MYLLQPEKTEVNFLDSLNNPKTTSNKYGTTQTRGVIEVIKDNGFDIRATLAPNARNEENRQFNKHVLRITRPELLKEQNIPEIVFINNNNNRGSAQIMLGIFRMICQNGMILGDTIHSQKIRHDSNFLDNLDNGLQLAFKDFDKTKLLLETMQNIELSSTEISAYKHFISQEVLVPMLSNKNTQKISIDNSFNPLRVEDQRNDLYTTFNRVQEHVITKGIKYQRIDEIKKEGVLNNELKFINGTTRTIKAIDKNVKVNQELMNKTLDYFNIAI